MPQLAETEKMRCPTCGTPKTGDLASGLCITCLSIRHSSDLNVRESSEQTRAVRLPPGFEYLEFLGRGGMGVVHLAFQQSLNRYVALKQLAGSWQQAPKAQDRFLREAKAAARLNHPGIVRILETGTHDDAAWYTMEYIEGGDLSQLLERRGGALPWKEAVRMLIGISEALQFAHDASIAHRDLKPSNVLLDLTGAPKICDFGLAWMAGQEGAELTASGEILGTPAYLAPEQISATGRTSDARVSDIYSVGALLFHVVAGHPPYRGSHPMEILGSIVNDPTPRLSEATPGDSIPHALDRICSKCMEKRPEDRFRSAGELAIALSECLHGAPGLFPSIRLRRRTRRMLALLAVAFAIGGGIYWRHQVSNSRGMIPADSSVRTPTVAVVQPQALGSDEATNLLAGGLQDELVSTLTRISNLPVVATRSVSASKTDPGDFRAAKAVLGADVLLAASVQKWQDRFRISVELIDTTYGRTLWSEHFDRPETNLLDLQTDIATQVAVHLNAHLRPGWNKKVMGISSTVPEAEHLFLRARALANDASASVVQLEQSETLLKQAVVLDPKFALGYALLSNVHAQMYNWGNDRSDRRLGLSLDSAQRAVQLNPDLAEGEIALGNYFFRGFRDYPTARPHFERAVELEPNNPDALTALAYVERREGDFRSASTRLNAALNLDPLNAVLAYNAADTLLRQRAYDRASDSLEHSLKLMRNQVALQKLRGDLYVAWKGDLGPMGEEIQHRAPSLPTPDLYVYDRIEFLVLSRRIDEALKVLRESKLHLLEGQSIYLTRDGFEAILLNYSGQEEAAKTLAKRARESLTEELQRRPNDARVLLHAGQMYAIEGDFESASKLIERTLKPGDLACVDAFDRGYFLRSYAIALAGSGQGSKALGAIRELLAGFNQYSVSSLRLHPALSGLIENNP